MACLSNVVMTVMGMEHAERHVLRGNTGGDVEEQKEKSRHDGGARA